MAYDYYTKWPVYCPDCNSSPKMNKLRKSMLDKRHNQIVYKSREQLDIERIKTGTPLSDIQNHTTNVIVAAIKESDNGQLINQINRPVTIKEWRIIFSKLFSYQKSMVWEVLCSNGDFVEQAVEHKWCIDVNMMLSKAPVINNDLIDFVYDTCDFDNWIAHYRVNKDHIVHLLHSNNFETISMDADVLVQFMLRFLGDYEVIVSLLHFSNNDPAVIAELKKHIYEQETLTMLDLHL